MQFKQLGSTDIQLSVVIMGTWQAGKAMWVGVEDKDTTEAMRAAFDAGITTFDTATVYGDGHSERLLGKALADIRKEVIIATKVFAHSLAYEKVFKACHQSLKDLGTDYIDLYQIHWPAGSFGSPKIPIGETMQALNELKGQGKIRAIGVSNFSITQLEDALQFGAIDSVQPPYSLFWRQADEDIIPYCAEQNISMLAYSPMAQGILAGKFGPDYKLAKKDHRNQNRLFQPKNFERVLAALDKLRPIAKRNDISLAQLALAWVASRPGNCCPIAGARNAKQIVESAKAGDVNLSQEDVGEIDAIGRSVTDHIDDDPVMWTW